MNPDPFWQRLVTQSKPTYAHDSAPPFGLITRTLAQLRAQRAQQELMERIGLRALWVSLGTLASVAGLVLVLNLATPVEPDRSVERFAQVDGLNLL